MERYKVLINNSFSATTAPTGPYSVSLINGLYLNTIGIGGGITNSSNINSYLNNSANTQITNDFYSYLTGNTTPVEFNNVFSNNQTLSDVFNSYYQNYVVSATTSVNTTVLVDSLSAATELIGYGFYNNWLTAKPINTLILSGIPLNFSGNTETTIAYTFLQNISADQNYYIPVVLNINSELLARDSPVISSPQITSGTTFLYPNSSAATEYFSASSPSTFYVMGSATTISSNTLLSNLVVENINSLAGSGATLSIFTGDTTRIDTIIQNFVILNLETNENIDYYYNP